MSSFLHPGDEDQRFAHYCRLAVIAIGTLILCSCRAPDYGGIESSGYGFASIPAHAAGETADATPAWLPSRMVPHGESQMPPAVPTSVPRRMVKHSKGDMPPIVPASLPNRMVPHDKGAMPPVVPVSLPHRMVPPCPEGQPHAAAMPCPPYGAMPPCPIGPPGMEMGVPLPYQCQSAWIPPGLNCPWPQDEYICDGGDRLVPADVTTDWEVRGLNLEDAIAHYDTVDGQRIVEPSNRVCIYSPRFRAVRKVVGANAYNQAVQSGGMLADERIAHADDVRPVLAAKQQIQPEGQIAANPPVIVHSKQGDGVISTAIKALAFQDAFLPFENVSAIRAGIVDMAEMPFLAVGHQAAVAWETRQAVQVVIDEQRATELVKDQEAVALYTVKPQGTPDLRLIKAASTPFANPGDVIDFTLRFDNIGSQVIGNVTIVDNLSPRLEYVPDSAQCSLDAQFVTQMNEAGSLVVRCEVEKPLEAGDGGIFRFQCRVR
ncbi:MAG: hypothetical protein ACOY3P_06665 [Planctomycetota bacterium]